MHIFSNIKALFNRKHKNTEKQPSPYEPTPFMTQDFIVQLQARCRQVLAITGTEYDLLDHAYSQLTKLYKSSLLKLPAKFLYSSEGSTVLAALAYTQLYYWLRSDHTAKDKELEMILREEIDRRKRIAPVLRDAVKKIRTEELTDQPKYTASLEYFRKMCLHQVDKLAEDENQDQAEVTNPDNQ